MRETGVEPGSLALEISKNVLMSDPQSALDKLRLLRELGARRGGQLRDSLLFAL